MSRVEPPQKEGVYCPLYNQTTKRCKCDANTICAFPESNYCATAYEEQSRSQPRKIPAVIAAILLEHGKGGRLTP